MKIDGDMAEILGMHIGDGCISVNKRYSEYYLGGDITEEKEYHNNWVAPLFNRKIMIPLYNRKVLYKEHPKVGIYGFHIFDKKIVDFFNSLGVPSGNKINIGIPENIKKDKTLLKRFLRGLFDTDGNIYFDRNRSAKVQLNNRPVIQLGTVSKRLADEVFKSLVDFGLHPRMKNPHQGKRDKNPVHTVLIYRIGDVNWFIDNIQFKNPKHSSKWQIYKKLGFCVPHTTLEYRKKLLSKSL